MSNFKLSSIERQLMSRNQKLKNENKGLRAVNVRLREMLDDVVDYFSADYYSDGSETDLMVKRVEATLAEQEKGESDE